MSGPCIQSGIRGCNVCGFGFRRDPHYHFRGNFFTAHCDYVRKLHPPSVFSQKRIDMCIRHGEDPFGLTLNATDVSRMDVPTVCRDNPVNASTPLLTEQANSFGRFAMEAWIGSHPSLVPCGTNTRSLDQFTTGWEEHFLAKPLFKEQVRGRVQPNERESIHRHVTQAQLLYGPDTDNENEDDNAVVGVSSSGTATEEDVVGVMCSLYDSMIAPHPCEVLLQNYTKRKLALSEIKSLK